MNVAKYHIHISLFFYWISSLLFIPSCAKPIQNFELSTSDGYRIIEDSISISVLSKGQLVLKYHTTVVPPPLGSPEYYSSSGHVHPLNTPKGKTITDDFPVGHTHQHGLYNIWTKAKFKNKDLDFWNQQEETGYVRHLSIRHSSFEKDVAQFTVILEHSSREDGPAIKEERTYKFSKIGQFNIIDISLNQTAATTETVLLKKYHYGGFAIRGSKYWNDQDAEYSNEMKVITNEGFDREKANHSRPEWIAAYGMIGDNIGGVVVFSHPTNFRHPQPVRVHPSMPYFVFTPVHLGEIKIVPDENYISNFRVITFDGYPNKEDIEAVWNTYKVLEI